MAQSPLILATIRSSASKLFSLPDVPVIHVNKINKVVRHTGFKFGASYAAPTPPMTQREHPKLASMDSARTFTTEVRA